MTYCNQKLPLMDAFVSHLPVEAGRSFTDGFLSSLIVADPITP